MGSCWCKEKTSVEVVVIEQPIDDSEGLSAEDCELYTAMRPRHHDDMCTDQYVNEMIRLVGSVAQSFEEQPAPLVKLHHIADGEEGWQRVISSLVHSVPLCEPLGPSAVTIIFDDCPLPPNQIILETLFRYGLCTRKAQLAYSSGIQLRFARNLLIVLGCMADKFAGPTSTRLMTPDVLDYVFYFLRDYREPELCLHAVIALEKFAKTMENKNTLKVMLDSMINPLVALERYYGSPINMWRQVGFCARWMLDNIFVVENRPLSYTTLDMTSTNAILDSADTTDFLKISSDGLEARSDSHTFESVRSTFSVDRGCWYYEVEIVTPGVMQIGWATKETKFKTHEGFGIGDDSFSLAYDGCRRLLWHNANPRYCGSSFNRWEPGDTLGCLIDVTNRQAVFSLNGVRLPICTDIFKHTKEGFYAAASFMCFQQARFNFGKEEFKYAPTDRQFMLFNDIGILTREQKQVIPRWLYLRHLQEQQALRDSEQVETPLCAVCYDNRPDCIFSPCRHKGFCRQCAYKITACPLCRERVWHFTVLPL